VADGTCSFPNNFFGCENAASRYTGGVKYIADDYAIECEVSCRHLLCLFIDKPSLVTLGAMLRSLVTSGHTAPCLLKLLMHKDTAHMHQAAW
jgi:hypothetical protein